MGYVFDTASCYRFVDTTQSWLDAETQCEEAGRGAHLVEISDPLEAAFVDALAPGNVGDHWYGLSDRRQADTYLLVTGSVPAFTPWQLGEPNSAQGDCVRFLDDRTLQVADCTVPDNAVCEFDGVPADPTSL